MLVTGEPSYAAASGPGRRNRRRRRRRRRISRRGSWTVLECNSLWRWGGGNSGSRQAGRQAGTVTGSPDFPPPCACLPTGTGRVGRGAGEPGRGALKSGASAGGVGHCKKRWGRKFLV